MIDREVRFSTMCWSDQLADALTAELPALQQPTDLTNFDTVLRLLLSRGHSTALEYAENTLDTHATTRDSQIARRAALALVYEATPNTWPTVFAAMSTRPAWGRELVEDLATGYRQPNPLIQLEEAQLGELYRWLLEQYPPEEDIWRPEFHFVSRREDARNWRDRVLTTLQLRSNAAAINELANLVSAYPNRPWLRRTLASAQESYRSTVWTPIRLRELRALIAAAE